MGEGEKKRNGGYCEVHILSIYMHISIQSHIQLSGHPHHSFACLTAWLVIAPSDEDKKTGKKKDEAM